MSDWNIGGPGRGRKLLEKSEHEGHLFLFTGVEILKDQQTAYGATDVAQCAYVVCVDDNLVLANSPMYGTAIVPALEEGAIDHEIIIANLGKGRPTPGQSPPWILFDPTPDDLVRANEFLDKYAARMPSGAIVIEVPDPAGASEPF